MKRFVSLILLAVLVISVVPIKCFALENEGEFIIERFEDGSYMTERIITNHSRASGTKTGSKEKIYYDASGNADWKATVTGTFTYTGGSSACTTASCSVTIYDSAWYSISKSASKSGNTATANVAMGEKLLGVKVNEVSTSVSLKCDANGNLS